MASIEEAVKSFIFSVDNDDSYELEKNCSVINMIILQNGSDIVSSDRLEIIKKNYVSEKAIFLTESYIQSFIARNKIYKNWTAENGLKMN